MSTAVTKEQIIRQYEVALVVSPAIEDDAREAVVKSVGDQIRAWDGEVDKTEEAGKKILAYPIQKFNEAWYYFLDVTLSAEYIHELDMKLRLEDSIIRHLIVKKED